MAENKRAFRGVWIPAEVWTDENLSFTLKGLLVEIDSLDCEPDGCYASNTHFAKFLNIDRQYVSQLISKLCEMEYVRLESFDGRKRVLRSLMKKVYGQRVIVERAEQQPVDTKQQAASYAADLEQLYKIPDFMEAWFDFMQNRKKIRRPMTPAAMKLVLRGLIKIRDEFGTADVIASLNRSTKNGYPDVYPPKQNNFANNGTHQNGNSYDGTPTVR